MYAHMYMQCLIERTTIAVQRLPPEGQYCLFWPRLPEVEPARLLAWAVLCGILPKSADHSAHLIYCGNIGKAAYLISCLIAEINQFLWPIETTSLFLFLNFKK